MENINTPASELTKLEYALIHSSWEPVKDDVDFEMRRDRLANPYNDSYKPEIRSTIQIVKELKIRYFTLLLS